VSDHLHAAAWLDLGDTVSVRLDEPANVMLITDDAYAEYKAGRTFKYLGGWVTDSQLTLWPPKPGLWHVVVDLGGRQGRVSASVQVLRG
jgi:hypothetical protein